jgi:hypothetical protein
VISFLAGIFIVLIKFGPLDYVPYARYYFYYIRRFLLKRLGIRVRPATRIIDARPLILDVPQELAQEELCFAD